MKKKKLIFLFAICLLCFSVTLVYAAFMYNQTVTTTSKVGNIEIISKNFISYAPDIDYTDKTTYPGGKADCPAPGADDDCPGDAGHDAGSGRHGFPVRRV